MSSRTGNAPPSLADHGMSLVRSAVSHLSRSHEAMHSGLCLCPNGQEMYMLMIAAIAGTLRNPNARTQAQSFCKAHGSFLDLQQGDRFAGSPKCDYRQCTCGESLTIHEYPGLDYPLLDRFICRHVLKSTDWNSLPTGEHVQRIKLLSS